MMIFNIPLTIEMFVYSGIIFGIIVIFLILSLTKLRVIPYLYANTRLTARSKSMLNESKLRNISEAKSLGDFCSNLGETEYIQNISNKNDLENIHKGIEKTYYQEISELESMAPKQVKSLFNSYLIFSESKIVKTIYRKRSKNEKINPEEFPNVGAFNKILLDKIANSESLADLKVILANTVFGEILEKDYQTPLEFENALDEYILNKFITEINKAKIFDKKIVIELMRTRSDIQNLLIILKSIARGEDVSKRRALMKNKPFEEIAKSSTIEEFVEASKNTIFSDVFEKAFDNYKKDKSLYHFEIELQRVYRHMIEKNDILHYQGSFPIFSYLAKKEFEKGNLYAVSKGIDAGFSSKDIMEMVI